MDLHHGELSSCEICIYIYMYDIIYIYIFYLPGDPLVDVPTSLYLNWAMGGILRHCTSEAGPTTLGEMKARLKEG